MSAETESYTRLQGNWLLVARLVSVAAIMLAVILHVAALPVVFDIFRIPCYAEPCKTPFQAAIPVDSEQPEQDTLQSAWRVSIIETFVVLLTLSVALFIFWRRSDDWMAHLASIMLVSIINVISPWPTILADSQPIWHWPRALSWAIGLGSGVGLFYLFPDGRFVPRWTTRLAVIFLFIIVFMAVSGAPFLAGIAIFVVILATGMLFQIYHYRRVSGPIQRQQTKWVVLGIIGMALPMLIVLCFGILNPALSPYLNAGTRSPKAAEIFGNMVIYGWVFPFCFLPVTLAFSILRYRLWEVDFFINRTLLYGALTTSVVVLYVLIVGGLSIGLQTQSSLSGIVIASLVVALIFRPLRERLQLIADRFVPVLRSVPPIPRQRQKSLLEERSKADTILTGYRLSIARLAWMIMFITLTVMYVLGFLAVHKVLSTACKEEPCTLYVQIRHTEEGEQVMEWTGPPEGFADPLRPDQVKVLEPFGLTLDQYGWLGALQMGIPALVYVLIAAGLFWWKSDDWMVLFASTMVMMLPLVDMPLPYTLVVRRPVWQWVYIPTHIVAVSSFFIFPLVFPTGRFMPRWTRWKLLSDIAFATIATLPQYAIFRPPGFNLLYIIFSFVTNAYALSYRYFRVASPAERQQIKWVVVGVVGFVSVAIMLNRFSYYHPIIIDSARALVLSAIPDTIYRTLTLFIPISITISVMRYRLWDIDIIISRTLVYGILSVGIVITYILLVGLFGTLFKTNVHLAAVLVTAALTIPSFQSARARVQRAVNRVTFSGSTEPASIQGIEEMQSESGLPQSSHWIKVAHIIWFLCTLSVAVVLLNMIPVYYSRYTHPILSDPYNLGKFNVPFQGLVGLGAFAESLISFALAVLLFWRKPNDRMALFVSFFFLITIVSSSYDYFLTAYYGAQALPLNLFSLVTFPLWILLFCIFPDGQFVPRWTRWLFLVSIATSIAFFVIPFSILQYTFGPQFILVTYAQVYRYRRISGDLERQQTRWVVLGWLMVMALSLLASFIYKKPSGPLINIFPLMLAIAILRSRLWNIDLILNRTLVYGALTAGIVALYIILVGTLSLLSQTTGNLLISLLATGLIAFLFQPLRERLQGSVNRLLYGDRDDPYAALSRLGRSLESTLAPGTVLPSIVTTVREALKLPYAAIYLKAHDNESNIIAESASSSLQVENGKVHVPGMEREGLCMPLIHQGETLGYLVLGPRAPNEAFGQSDLRLLDDLAPQVGVAVHSVRLTADLRLSRERLVLAREEERRRLRRDLHDDLAPTLASLGLTASTAADLITTNPEKAILLVKELQNEIRSTVGNIRRLVYDLRPPTLDELGLLAAVRERAMQYTNAPGGIRVIVDAPAELPALPAAVEVAVYRIVQEALENASKHSRARYCTIRFANHKGLEIEISDDGIGLSPNIIPGIGLRSMQERAEELGGSCVIERGVNNGTRVLACLPIGETNGSITSLDRG